MLTLTMGGRMISGTDAVSFFESLVDMIPKEVRTEEFCDEYTYAVNRLRYEVQKGVPVAPRVRKIRFTDYSCGQCGFLVKPDIDKYCPHCGRAIDWMAVLP